MLKFTIYFSYLTGLDKGRTTYRQMEKPHPRA
jgi:hypothetical protein